MGYRLGFSATGLASPLVGDSYIESEAFTVGVGPAYRLELEDDILAENIVSGSPFADQVTSDPSKIRNKCSSLFQLSLFRQQQQIPSCDDRLPAIPRKQHVDRDHFFGKKARIAPFR